MSGSEGQSGYGREHIQNQLAAESLHKVEAASELAKASFCVQFPMNRMAQTMMRMASETLLPNLSSSRPVQPISPDTARTSVHEAYPRAA